MTWKYGLYLLIEWLAAGVDMDSTVVTLVTSVARDNKARFFIVTDEFKALVTEWIDVTIPNYKFIFKQAKEETSVAVAGVHQFVHMVSDKKSYCSPNLLITYFQCPSQIRRQVISMAPELCFLVQTKCQQLIVPLVHTPSPRTSLIPSSTPLYPTRTPPSLKVRKISVPKKSPGLLAWQGMREYIKYLHCLLVSNDSADNTMMVNHVLITQSPGVSKYTLVYFIWCRYT